MIDLADRHANRHAIHRLVRGADVPFIEAAFAEADAGLAAERAQLATAAAGSVAREAVVHRVEPFHFSPRYSGQKARLLNEIVRLLPAGDVEVGSLAPRNRGELTEPTARTAIGPKDHS